MSISRLVLVMHQALRGNQAFQVQVSDGLLWLMYNGHHPESRGGSDPFPSPTHAIRVAQPPPPFLSNLGPLGCIWPHPAFLTPLPSFEGGVDKDGSAISSLLQDRQQ